MPRGPLAPSKRSSARGSKSGSILPFRGAADKSRRPYSEIFINTDVGNPTAPVATPPLSKAGPKRSWRRLSVFSLFITGPRLVSFLQSSIESSPRSKFQHLELQIQAFRTFNDV